MRVMSRIVAAGQGLVDWVDERFPLVSTWKYHMSEYYAPKNFNFWYYFGSLAMIVLVLQIVTGIFLTMNYKPDALTAFGSVEYIMRDVSGGWFIRYMHSTGASMFFVVVYLHMMRALLYGSYRKPRELLWIFGCMIYLALMAEAFMGYLLPWGQMSYWGAQVIVNLFSSVPFIGPELSVWIRGDFLVSDATLNRFFALHVIALPLVLVGLVFLHLVVFFIVFFAILFFGPEMGGYFLEYNNFLPADPLQTPAHIAPVWYFTPFYAMLRAVPAMFGSQFAGVAVMGAGVIILFFLPWLDKSPVRSIRYKGPIFRAALAIFVVSFLVLGYLGVATTDVWGRMPEVLPIIGGVEVATIASRLLTLAYFAFFLAMPWYSRIDKCKPEPERLTG